MMASELNQYAHQLRLELGARNRVYARGRAHVESYGNPPVIVYTPEDTCHGNFFDAAYKAICCRPEWMRRFDKVHAQARSLPKAERRWRELDSSMSSDALLMNVFCTPGVVDSPAVRSMLGIDRGQVPVFGWKARVPLKNSRFDRTEVDMRCGELLVEAKLTESDFQTCRVEAVEAYRDFDEVFDPELLPIAEIPVARRKLSTEFPEEYTQEEVLVPAEDWQPTLIEKPRECVEGYASYQLIRNVLAAYAANTSFCVILDARRPDLLEAWFQVMRAVRHADMRVRMQALTWQELATALPDPVQEFLDLKYGIVGPGELATLPGETGDWTMAYSKTRVDVSRRHDPRVDATSRERQPCTPINRAR